MTKLAVENRSLGGRFFSDLFQYIKIGFKPCVGKTRDGKRCAKKSEIEAFLMGNDL